ncbi:hypothetical protein Taro_029514 [Colocasia esculenta]|uniref:Uncharacterized protein n=1 Tax=Colocasia esculenta TaxID=4460 RepID=A0A843W0G9_COLES|nr:hypothetical protein [Colocasia esculenta]
MDISEDLSLCVLMCVPRVASAFCLTLLVMRESCWARPWLWFYFRFVGVPTTLAGKVLVIPSEPCSRGSPPYSLQVGTRCRKSSLSDGRGGGLFTVRCQQCKL